VAVSTTPETTGLAELNHMKGVILLLALLLLPSSGWTSTKTLDRAVGTATLYALKEMPKAARQTLAKAGLAYWKSFDERIPRNSPQVEEWLKSELSTTDIDRIRRVTTGPEYALNSLAQTSKDCVTLFNMLVDNPEVPALTELYLWTKTLSCYKSPNDILLFLKTAKLSDGHLDGRFSLEHFYTYHSTITGPLANSIVAEGQEAR
jgi:hypothetical protein